MGPYADKIISLFSTLSPSHLIFSHAISLSNKLNIEGNNSIPAIIPFSFDLNFAVPFSFNPKHALLE